MNCAISQPTYLPWLGLFNLIDMADVFVFYDDVQLVKQSWGTRNQIKTHQGILWLSVPIIHDKHFDEMLFNNTQTDEKKHWKKKHFKTICNAYSKAAYFKPVIEWLEDKLKNETSILGDMNAFLIEETARIIGIKTKFVKSSGLHSKEGVKDNRLVSICRELGANKYISPLGSYKYIEEFQESGAFNKTEICLEYHNYEHPAYPQLHGYFIGYMCILDLLFNVGFDNALEVIISGKRQSFTSSEIRKKYLNE